PSEGHYMYTVRKQKGASGQRNIILYASTLLDPIAKKATDCALFADTLASLLKKVAHVVMGHSLVVYTSHSVVAYVQSKTFALTPQRQLKLAKELTAPNLTFAADDAPNASAGLTLTGSPHCCESFSQSQARIRPDLSDQPLPDSRLLFTDGHCHRLPDGSLSAGAAVVELSPPDHTRTVASWGPCGGSSAQFAELMALKLALEVASGQRVTIYTDSAYVCGLVLRDLSSWKRNGFLTAKGTPIAHKELFKRLKLALYEVCKNVGKTPGENLVMYCNEAGIVLVKMRGAVPDQH
uniref:RNase H type-1 domain-containing protein n=1 Tax=Neogobius melanostomus TaxID=47308 RepID=A0A8C6SBA8_9GOBI